MKPIKLEYKGHKITLKKDGGLGFGEVSGTFRRDTPPFGDDIIFPNDSIGAAWNVSEVYYHDSGKRGVIVLRRA